MILGVVLCLSRHGTIYLDIQKVYFMTIWEVGYFSYQYSCASGTDRVFLAQTGIGDDVFDRDK